MVVVLHRTAITLMVLSLRSLAHLKIPTAGFGDFAALAVGTASHREDAGIQAREDAEKQQGCEKESHQWPQNRRIGPKYKGKSNQHDPRSRALPEEHAGVSLRPE